MEAVCLFIQCAVFAVCTIGWLVVPVVFYDPDANVGIVQVFPSLIMAGVCGAGAVFSYKEGKECSR